MLKLIFGVSITAILLHFVPVEAILIWHKQAILEGEYWRVITGQFLHTNLAHLMMNLLALWCIAFIFKPTTNSFLTFFSFSMLFIGISLLFTDTALYVGLSGMLHGFFAYYAIQEVLDKRWYSLVLVIGVVAKVGSEWVLDIPLMTSALIEATVSRESHFLGLVSAVVLIGLVQLKKAVTN